MSLRTDRLLRCDVCIVVSINSEPGESARSMRYRAKQAGWIRRAPCHRHPEDVCPTCQRAKATT